ncbi:TetR/AcrR family transcriptional regulator [Undibacterium terreum]|uniref:TetR family transcriptional regulator n=1 Tax=Undibacterium terreum TaxID=1224302 RepID=A0A916U953_9BURK|nr:TetR/AcrR family transcriptional regulator [Undibacterium terreum]GGC64439.1 TetR family transcriptional regulator [Undibacterium terreum]
MKKSKIETAETRKRIVSIASRIFMEQGLAATGIADVMKAAGLTQGGFYRHFESKEQLIAEANAAAGDNIYERLEQAIAGKSPADALETTVQLYLNQFRNDKPEYLCPLASLGTELLHSDEQVKIGAAAGYQRLVDFMAVQTRKLNLLDHGRVACAIVSTMIGAGTLSKLAPNETRRIAALDNAANMVRLLIQAAPRTTAQQDTGSPTLAAEASAT